MGYEGRADQGAQMRCQKITTLFCTLSGVRTQQKGTAFNLDAAEGCATVVVHGLEGQAFTFFRGHPLRGRAPVVPCPTRFYRSIPFDVLDPVDDSDQLGLVTGDGKADLRKQDVVAI